MPAPRWLARFNRHVTNRLLSPIARRQSGWGIIVHTGRTSGRQYRTPVNIFPRPGGYVIALTYGADSEWVRNVLANGGCQLETRGRTVALTQPRLVQGDKRRRDEILRTLPWFVRPPLRLLAVSDFLELSWEEDAQPARAEQSSGAAVRGGPNLQLAADDLMR